MNHDATVEMRMSELLSDRPRRISDLAIQIRREIVKSAKGCSELLYKTYAVSNVFSYTGKLGQAFIHIATYSNHVNLGFNHGALLNDPDQVLKGTGKLIRHIRISSISDLKRKSVKDLIREAIEHGNALADKSGGPVPQAFVDKSA